jgi:hypothetical protein
MAGQTGPAMSAGSTLTSDQQTWIYSQFNGTTFQANAMDVQHEPLYDEVTTAAGATIANLTQFFTNPAGKTLAQTNVTTAKRLDAPEAFAVMGINFTFLENILLADAINIGNSFALEFWIGQKYYNRAPVTFYNAGRGVYASAATVSGFSAITNGLPAKGHRHELAINIVIDNQASFFGQLVGTPVVLTASGSGGTGATLYDLLDGLHARGVQ